MSWKRPPPRFFVERALADLVDEEEVGEAVAVDVRDGHRGAVIVVDRPVVLADVHASRCA